MRTLPRPHQPVQLDTSLAIVNIVLLLILFFLATGQLLNPPKQDVDLAETSELPLDELPSPILIITADGSWELDGARVAPDLLGTAVNNLPEPVILHVMVNREAPASALMEVLAQPELAETEMRLVTVRRVVSGE
ncbi:biopolymer transport protein ExbD [Cognatiyoonia koreensis]|uniref:Biopolymer transport protein ExbD n=1 Tax=Cognatiyoonia koreensis TaxID=364200 RepID=A0A1I0RGR2_9RHOB|nr:biopolymer transporter ExbD [Cognatiyoonia koreensis]SEW40108.1 biopolymer transport protein ExbD [Cognatiyoonia koreensis]